MKTTFLFLVISILTVSSLIVQVHAQKEQCGTMEYLAASIAENPSYQRKINRSERRILRFKKRETPLSKPLIIIPVIVHVLWNTPAQKISYAQVLSQINVLNEDYRKFAGTNGFNNNPIGADTNIEFRLAEHDKGGNPILGIQYTRTTVVEFKHDSNNLMKYRKKGGADAWNSEYYLNIWVCNLAKSSTGQLLGFATFPGGNPSLDGVVIHYKNFGDKVGTSITGSFNLGRTTTHEVGHWLNLYHTFQGNTCENNNCLEDGDKVCDTPPVDTATSGCPVGRKACKQTTLISDYMDYSNDACMNIITKGQDYRVRITMEAIRDKLSTSPGLVNHNFSIFGEHSGSYNYVLDNNFYVEGAGLYPNFQVDGTSSVSIRTMTKGTVTFGRNIKILKGATFTVSLN